MGLRLQVPALLFITFGLAPEGPRSSPPTVPGEIATAIAGTTPVMAAAANGSAEIGRQLVAAVADPHAVDWQGRTAVDLAPPDMRGAFACAIATP